MLLLRSRREDLRPARLLDAYPHGLHNLGDVLVHPAEHPVLLRLLILDEVATLPEGVARLIERLRLQPQLLVRVVGCCGVVWSGVVWCDVEWCGLV